MNLKNPGVAELEAEIERLQARIRELETRPASMISEGARSGGFVAPSSRELKALYSLGTRLAPKLALDDSPEHYASFAAAERLSARERRR